ncbi:MAG: hypothetical protein ACRERE_43855 [Candidatus Entotheonellia bacterium]
MEKFIPLWEVLEAIDSLSIEEQEMVIEVLHRGLIERRRDQLSKAIQQAEQEFRAGRCRSVIPAE